MSKKTTQYEYDKPFSVDAKEPYLLKSDHRNKSGKKSQWTIKPSEEVDVFVSSQKAGWHDASDGWGLHMPNSSGSPEFLGNTVDKRRVGIAKFVSNDMPKYWHGYPADYQNKTQDRPSEPILKAWYNAGFIKKYEISRIRSGNPCSLSE